MDANQSLELIKSLTSEKVLTIDLGSLWSARVWQFSDSENKQTVIRMALEGYYDPEIGGFYRPSGGKEAFEAAAANGHKVSITCFVFVHSEMLPQASREMKKTLEKKWRVWATGALDIKLSHLNVTEGSNGSLYLEAPMCRLRGQLKGHGISDLSFKALPWAEEDIDIVL